MEENQKDIKSIFRSLAEWASFGSGVADMMSNGMLCCDLHQGNLGRLPKHNSIVLIDYGSDSFYKIKYPDEWEKAPAAILTLLSWLNNELGAAFRFGFVCQGGSVANQIFKLTTEKYEYNSFDDSGLNFVCKKALLPSSDEIQKMNEQLLHSRKYFIEGSHAEQIPSIETLSNWRVRKQELGIQGYHIADEYFYKKHLIAAIYHGNILYAMEALVNLEAYYTKSKRYFEAGGVLLYARHMLTFCKEGLEKVLVDAIESNNGAYIENLPEAQIDMLNIIPKFNNIFRFFCAMDDCLSGEVLLEME